MKHNRITALALTIMLLAGMMLACGEKAPSDNSGTTAAPTTVAGDTAEPTEARLEPDLPEKDFGGYSFRFLSHREESVDWVEPAPRELVAETETSDPINDAVYLRNAKIKEKYNVNFSMQTELDEKAAINKSVKAGDDLYDAVLLFNNNIPTTITSGLLMQVNTLPFIDLDQPWWDPAAKSMSIVGKDYLLAGDMLILDNEATNCLLFNKDMMVNYGMELPYQSVLDGTWTMDKLYEYVKQVAQDLDNDGKLGRDDIVGLTGYNDTLQAFLVGGGGALAVKDADDKPVISFQTAKNISILEKAMDIFYDRAHVLNCQAEFVDADGVTVGQQNYNMFANNKILFMWARMRVVEEFRGMDANFGILPMPKYDTNQTGYHSLVNPYTGVMLAVPKTCSDLERTSIILEALCAESRYTLQPAYYDVVLTRKFARDEESKEMLSIIFNSRVYDIGGGYSFNNLFLEFNQQIAQKYDRNIQSFYEKRAAKYEAAINKIVDLFQELD